MQTQSVTTILLSSPENQLRTQIAPFAENIALLAAKALHHNASAIVLLTSAGAEIVGSFGLEQVPTLKIVPQWLLPTRPRFMNTASELATIAKHLGMPVLQGAIGISIIMPDGIVGAIWLFNAVAPTAQNNQILLLEAFAQQIVLNLISELQLLELQKPHQIARERDLAFSVAQSLPTGVIVTDLNGAIVFVNVAYSKSLGYKLEDFRLKRLQNFVLPNFVNTITEALTARANGESTIYRYQIYRKDQSIADVEAVGHPRLDAKGKVIGNIATIRDITEELALERATLEARKAINRKLSDTLVETKRSLEREKGYALEILETLQDGFALLNTKGIFEYVNPAFAALCGFSAQALIGIESRVFVHPDDFENLKHRAAQLEPGQVARFEHRMRRQDKTIIQLETHLSLRLDQQKQAIGTLLSTRDITEKLANQRKLELAQRQVLHQREMAMTIVQTAQEGFLMLKGEIIEFANQQLEQILGLPIEQLVGQNILRFVHPDDLAISKNGIQTIIQGQEITYRQRVLRPNNEIRTIIFFAKPRLSASGRVYGIIGSVRDITNELETEAKVTQLELQLGKVEEKFAQGTGFYGRLETVGGAVGLMQMLLASPVGGAINLDDSVLFFEHGRITAVVHPSLKGREAAQALVQRQKGQFQFIPEVCPANSNLNLDPTQLALEYLTQQDQIKHQANQEIPNLPHQHQIVLPNAKAAKAFMQGVGGYEHFRVEYEQEQVVLYGRDMKIVVLNAQITDF